MGVIVAEGVECQEAPAGLLPIMKLSEGVSCLTNWMQDWGPNQQRLALHNYRRYLANYERVGLKPSIVTPPILYTTNWARTRLVDSLKKISNGLVLAAFPSFAPYNKNAALLLEQGFSLLGGQCYPNANYAFASYQTMPVGSVYSKDRYPHWIHIWVKDLGGLTKCGPMTYSRAQPAQAGAQAPNAQPPQPGAIQAMALAPAANAPLPEYVAVYPSCCGIRLRWSTGAPKRDPYAPTALPERYLSICQIEASKKFPKGWQRFARYEDFKWGINFRSEHLKGAQKCPHEYNLAAIEKWELEQALPA